MTRIYFINNKKVDLDSSEWNLIYKDGQWSDRGINLFWRKKDDFLILESWSKWQKEHDKIEILTRQEAIEFLLGEEYHPQRVNDAFYIIGHKPKNF